MKYDIRLATMYDAPSMMPYVEHYMEEINMTDLTYSPPSFFASIQNRLMNDGMFFGVIADRS